MLSPEEQRQLAAPPGILPPPEPVYEGPQPLPAPGSADALINGVTAQSAPAGASNGAIPDEWPPPVPAEAPGSVPVAPPLPGAPGAPPPAAPQAPPTPGSARKLEAAQQDAAKARELSDKAQIEEVKGQAPAVAAQAEAAEKRRVAAEESLAAHQAAQAKYDAAEQAAQKQVAETQAQLKDFKFRDFWADKSSVQRVGSALAVALGALGSGLTHTPNYALQILDKEMDDDHQRQADHLKQLTDQEVMARTGVQNIQQARAKALADITLGDAQKDKVIAAQLDEAAARSTDENYKNKVAAFTAKLGQESTEKQLEAVKILRNANLQDQAAARAADQEAVKAAESRSLAHLHDVQAAAGGFAPHRGKGAGGGGGGGSSRGDAYAAFKAAAVDGKTDAPTLGKLAIAAGLKPNQVDDAIFKARTEADREKKLHGSAAGAGGGGLAGERLVSKEAESWGKQNGIPDINKKQRELSAVLEEINNAPHNPLQQALAVEKAVSSARGGAASKQALQLALHHLGGRWDSIEAMVQGAKDGQLGEKQMENFVSFMRNQLGAAQKEGKDKYDEFNKYAESQSPEKRAALLNERGRLFSGLHGFGAGGGGGGGGGAHPAEAAVGATKQIGGKTYKKVGPNNWQPVTE